MPFRSRARATYALGFYSQRSGYARPSSLARLISHAFCFRSHYPRECILGCLSPTIPAGAFSTRVFARRTSYATNVSIRLTSSNNLSLYAISYNFCPVGPIRMLGLFVRDHSLLLGCLFTYFGYLDCMFRSTTDRCLALLFFSLLRRSILCFYLGLNA